MDWADVCWNLALAISPILPARLALKGSAAASLAGRIRAVVWAVVAIAILPNSTYLITGSSHFMLLTQDGTWTGWTEVRGEIAVFPFRLALFATYVGIGLVSFTLCVRPWAALLTSRQSVLIWLGPPVFLAVTLGVLMGREYRLNSWDLLLKPLHVWQVAHMSLSSPWMVSLVLGLGVCLYLGYVVMSLALDGAIARGYLRQEWVYPPLLPPDGEVPGQLTLEAGPRSASDVDSS